MLVRPTAARVVSVGRSAWSGALVPTARESPTLRIGAAVAARGAGGVAVGVGLGEDVGDVPAGVVVGEDRARVVRGCAGADEQARRGGDRVGGVPGVALAVAVAVDADAAPGAGLGAGDGQALGADGGQPSMTHICIGPAQQPCVLVVGKRMPGSVERPWSVSILPIAARIHGSTP